MKWHQAKQSNQIILLYLYFAHVVNTDMLEFKYKFIVMQGQSVLRYKFCDRIGNLIFLSPLCNHINKLSIHDINTFDLPILWNKCQALYNALCKIKDSIQCQQLILGKFRDTYCRTCYFSFTCSRGLWIHICWDNLVIRQLLPANCQSILITASKVTSTRKLVQKLGNFNQWCLTSLTFEKPFITNMIPLKKEWH